MNKVDPKDIPCKVDCLNEKFEDDLLPDRCDSTCPYYEPISDPIMLCPEHGEFISVYGCAGCEHDYYQEIYYLERRGVR